MVTTLNPSNHVNHSYHGNPSYRGNRIYHGNHSYHGTSQPSMCQATRHIHELMCLHAALILFVMFYVLRLRFCIKYGIKCSQTNIQEDDFVAKRVRRDQGCRCVQGLRVCEGRDRQTR